MNSKKKCGTLHNSVAIFLVAHFGLIERSLHICDNVSDDSNAHCYFAVLDMHECIVMILPTVMFVLYAYLCIY